MQSKFVVDELSSNDDRTIRLDDLVELGDRLGECLVQFFRRRRLSPDDSLPFVGIVLGLTSIGLISSGGSTSRVSNSPHPAAAAASTRSTTAPGLRTAWRETPG